MRASTCSTDARNVHENSHSPYEVSNEQSTFPLRYNIMCSCTSPTAEMKFYAVKCNTVNIKVGEPKTFEEGAKMLDFSNAFQFKRYGNSSINSMNRAPGRNLTDRLTDGRATEISH